MGLTIKQIDAARPRPRPYRLSDGNGLVLQITPNGSKLWRMRYRYAGKEKMLSLGRYPEVSLKTARERRDQERRQLSNGVDPSETRRGHQREAKEKSTNTFGTIAVGWYEQKHVGFHPIAADTSEKLHHGKQEVSDGTEETTVQSRVQRGSGRAREAV